MSMSVVPGWNPKHFIVQLTKSVFLDKNQELPWSLKSTNYRFTFIQQQRYQIKTTVEFLFVHSLSCRITQKYMLFVFSVCSFSLYMLFLRISIKTCLKCNSEVWVLAHCVLAAASYFCECCCKCKWCGFVEEKVYCGHCVDWAAGKADLWRQSELSLVLHSGRSGGEPHVSPANIQTLLRCKGLHASQLLKETGDYCGQLRRAAGPQCGGRQITPPILLVYHHCIGLQNWFQINIRFQDLDAATFYVRSHYTNVLLPFIYECDIVLSRQKTDKNSSNVHCIGPNPLPLTQTRRSLGCSTAILCSLSAYLSSRRGPGYRSSFPRDTLWAGGCRRGTGRCTSRAAARCRTPAPRCPHWGGGWNCAPAGPLSPGGCLSDRGLYRTPTCRPQYSSDSQITSQKYKDFHFNSVLIWN